MEKKIIVGQRVKAVVIDPSNNKPVEVVVFLNRKIGPEMYEGQYSMGGQIVREQIHTEQILPEPAGDPDEMLLRPEEVKAVTTLIGDAYKTAHPILHNWQLQGKPFLLITVGCFPIGNIGDAPEGKGQHIVRMNAIHGLGEIMASGLAHFLIQNPGVHELFRDAVAWADKHLQESKKKN